MAKSKISEMEEHHETVVDGVVTMMKPVLDKSEQPIFVYLDDNHKSCNKRFAAMLGYGSPEEFSKVRENFVETFIAKESQEAVMRNYSETFTKKLSASVFQGEWKKKDGSTVNTTVIHVPISYDGHLVALGFVSEKR